jgi:hypothetical protein
VSTTKTQEPLKIELAPWARVIVAIAALGIIIKFTPILDILEIFLYFTLIPIIFLGAIGVISSETLNYIMAQIEEAKNVAKEKLKETAKPEAAKPTTEQQPVVEPQQPQA